MTLIVGIVCWSVLAGWVAYLIAHQRGRDRLTKLITGDRVVVTLKTGETFNGLQRDMDQRTVELVDVKALTVGSEPVKVDGVLYIARADIAYAQRP